MLFCIPYIPNRQKQRRQKLSKGSCSAFLPPSLPVPAWEVAGDRARLGRSAGCGARGTGGGGDSLKDAGSRALPGILECWRFGMDLFKVWLL